MYTYQNRAIVTRGPGYHLLKKKKLYFYSSCCVSLKTKYVVYQLSFFLTFFFLYCTHFLGLKWRSLYSYIISTLSVVEKVKQKLLDGCYNHGELPKGIFVKLLMDFSSPIFDHIEWRFHKNSQYPFYHSIHTAVHAHDCYY